MFLPPSFRWLLVCLALLYAPVLHAADDVDKNIAQLGSAEDFRVRTQAALALGASSQAKAVEPLCRALADTNRTVRIATATALSRLRMGGEDCLKKRRALEKDSAVQAAIDKAIERLSAAGGAEPAIGIGTKYFVAISKLAGPARLDGPVRAAFVKAALGNKQVAFAPSGQTVDAAAGILKKYQGAKGFQLAAKLSKPTYSDGTLQVKMSVAITTYPGNNLVGSFSRSVGMSGVSSENEATENELVMLVADEAMKQFLVMVPKLQ